MLDAILNTISDVEIFVAEAGSIVFAISYAVFFRWRKTPAGRALMYFILSLIAVFLVSALSRWLGHDYEAHSLVRVSVYTVVLVTVWRLVIVLWHNWRSDSPPLDLDQKTRKKDRS